MLGSLVDAARTARSNAYAPYSNYTVGAAVLTEDGSTSTGTNVENASYGATVCAERVAIWTAIATGARRITAMAVVTQDGGTPCGMCRQVLYEFAEESAPVAIAGPEGPWHVLRMGELLPFGWGAEDLKGDRT